MARTCKRGLDYYPLDVDFFQDLRIRKLIKYQGGEAVTVYTLLLCYIYKDGYYLRWDDDIPFVVSEQTGFEEAYISATIERCLEIGLFDKDLYEKERILTSRGIQERYRDVCEMARRKHVIDEFRLIDSCTKADKNTDKCTTIENKCTIIQDNCARNDINSAFGTQSKVKKNKIKRSSDDDPKKTPPPPPSPPMGGEELKVRLESDVKFLKGDVVWRDYVCLSERLDDRELSAWIDRFSAHCLCQGKQHTDMADTKSHFTQWLAIQLAKRRDENNNRTQSTATAVAERRRRVDPAGRTASDYKAAF
jgi:hypothetical protein